MNQPIFKKGRLDPVKHWEAIVNNTEQILIDLAPRAKPIIETVRKWNALPISKNTDDGMMTLLGKKLSGLCQWYSNYRDIRPMMRLTCYYTNPSLGLECYIVYDREKDVTYIQSIHYHKAIVDASVRTTTNVGLILQLVNLDNIQYFDATMGKAIHEELKNI